MLLNYMWVFVPKCWVSVVAAELCSRVSRFGLHGNGVRLGLRLERFGLSFGLYLDQSTIP